MSTRADNALTSKLNLSKANLQDTLILHTALGKDHFITISALYGGSFITLPFIRRLVLKSRTARTDLLLYWSPHTCTTSRSHPRTRILKRTTTRGSCSDCAEGDHANSQLDNGECIECRKWMRSNLNTAWGLSPKQNELFLANGDNKLFNTICEVLFGHHCPPNTSFDMNGAVSGHRRGLSTPRGREGG